MKLKMTLATVTAAVLMTGCGGGNDSAPGNGDNTVTPPQGNFVGAAAVGDFAKFSIAGNTLSYTLSGVVLGEEKGHLSIENVFGPVWKDVKSDLHLFLSGNLGIAKIPTGSGSIHVVGLQQSEDVEASKIAGKTYLYAYVPNSGSVEGHSITIDSNNTYSAASVAGATEKGCWKVMDSDHLVAKANAIDCNTVTDISADYRIALKPGTSRTGIVVDYVDGSGFGIGVEQKALTASDVATGTFNSYYYQPGEDGFSKVTLTNGNYEWSTCDEETGKCTPYTKGTIALNQLCNGTAIDGVACATDANSGYMYDLFVDPEDGYYISIGNNERSVEIGSNK